MLGDLPTPAPAELLPLTTAMLSLATGLAPNLSRMEEQDLKSSLSATAQPKLREVFARL